MKQTCERKISFFLEEKAKSSKKMTNGWKSKENNRTFSEVDTKWKAAKCKGTPLHQKLKRTFLFLFLFLKVLFVGSKGFFSHLFSFSGSEFSTCIKVGSLSKKVLKTDEAKCKIASACLPKKKKKHLLWVEQTRNNVVCFGKEKKMLLTHRLL